MKISFQLVSVFTSTVAIALTTSLLPQATSAQVEQSVPASVQSQPFDSNRSQERDSFSGNLGNNDFSVFNLIHQAQLGTLRDLSEFSQEQNRNITSEAEKFRLEQRRRLGNPSQLQPQAQPETQVETAPVGN